MDDTPRIVTVTLNPADDVTYRVERIVVGDVHRVTAIQRRAGGKGVNVSRVLVALGAATTATGLVGGPTGVEFIAGLDASGIDHRYHGIAGETRRTVTVVSDGTATVFNEPGPAVTAGEWTGFLRLLDDLVEGAAALVLSGSLPPGLASTTYAELLERYAEQPLWTAVDTSGEALAAAVGARPDLVKVNHDEALAVLGADGADPMGASAALHRRGAATAVVTVGKHGVVATNAAGGRRVVPPPVASDNPTGAGDTLMAGLVHTMLAGASLDEQLVTAVALAATTVESGAAGDVDVRRAREMAARLSVTT